MLYFILRLGIYEKWAMPVLPQPVFIYSRHEQIKILFQFLCFLPGIAWVLIELRLESTISIRHSCSSSFSIFYSLILVE